MPTAGAVPAATVPTTATMPTTATGVAPAATTMPTAGASVVPTAATVPAFAAEPASTIVPASTRFRLDGLADSNGHRHYGGGEQLRSKRGQHWRRPLHVTIKGMTQPQEVKHSFKRMDPRLGVESLHLHHSRLHCHLTALNPRGLGRKNDNPVIQRLDPALASRS
jgi:hypothetical protein